MDTLGEYQHIRALLRGCNTFRKATMEKKQEAGQPPVILNGRQVAAQLGVDRSTVTRWEREGSLPQPTVRHGHIKRWAAADIRRFAEGQQ